MDCPNCDHPNPQDARFCAECGESLTGEGQCSACRRLCPIESQFCAFCGAVLRCPACNTHDVGDGRFCKRCGQFLIAEKGVKIAGLGQRVGAAVLDVILLFLTLIIGYIIWELVFTLRHGQTPGKQILRIRAMRVNGAPSDWGWTFLREWIVKGIIFHGIGEILFGLPGLIDVLWAFWDKDRQTLHDKIMKTVVVDDTALRSETV
jgi:uncharacterized RDD family membrane protein YckC